MDPQGLVTTVRFTYGTSSALTSGATTITLPATLAGSGAQSVSVVIPSLTPGRGIYYRFEASSAGGTTRGSTEYSIVAPIAPTIKNTYGGNQTTISATLNVLANAGGSNTRWSFEYSRDPEMKTGVQEISGIPNAVTSPSDTVVSVTIGGLSPDTWYYFRAKVQSLTGPASGTTTVGPIATIQTLRSSDPVPVPAPPGLAGQTITFGSIADREFGPGVALAATSSSRLPVVYSSSTPSICRVLDLGAGKYAVQTAADLPDVDTATCTVVASQPGNSQYAAATPVSQSFTWRRAAMRIWTSSLSLTVGRTLVNNAYLGLVDRALMSGLYSLNSQVTVVSTTPTICSVVETRLSSSSNPYTYSRIQGLTKGTCSIAYSYPNTLRRQAVTYTLTTTVN